MNKKRMPMHYFAKWRGYLTFYFGKLAVIISSDDNCVSFFEFSFILETNSCKIASIVKNSFLDLKVGKNLYLIIN